MKSTISTEVILIILAEAATRAPLDPIVAWLATFHNRWPLVGVLLILMLIDVVMGFCAAFITKSISSTICSRGMVRKVMIMMLVGMCAAIEPYSGDIPLSKLASMAFIVFECTSIVENAARAGLPIPQTIVDTLASIKWADKQKPAVSAAPPNPAVTIGRANNVDIHTDAPLPKPGDSGITITQDVLTS